MANNLVDLLAAPHHGLTTRSTFETIGTRQGVDLKVVHATLTIVVPQVADQPPYFYEGKHYTAAEVACAFEDDEVHTL